MSNNISSKRGSDLESLLFSEQNVTVEKLSIGGDGVARIKFNERLVVIFIPDSCPGDQLKISIVSVEKNFLKGQILQIEKSGSSRREPPCAYFIDCGGCNWQHLFEHEQIKQKEIILTDLLNQFIKGTSFQLLETKTSEHKFNYRNRIQLKAQNNQLGYFKKRTHQIIEIEECLIAESPINAEIPRLRQSLKNNSDLIKYEIRINQNEQTEFYKIGDHGEGLAFSQVNRYVNNFLIESLNHIVNKILDQKNDSKYVLNATELYAGAGNFTFALLDKFVNLSLTSVELNSELTKYAVEHIKKRKLSQRATFFTTKAEVFAKNYPLSKDLVILDPPRSGCHSDLIHQLCLNKPKNILYISCNPSLLARDLQTILKKNSEYRILHLQIFDLFPQTDHFETLCWLSSDSLT